MPHVWRPLPVGFADGFWRIRIVEDPNEMVCTMSFDLPNPPTQSDANALMAAFGTRIMPKVTNVVTLEGFHVIYQNDSLNQVAVDSNSAAVAGTGTGGASIVPVNCAVLIRKRTGFAGRRNRGRMYVPGISEVDVNGPGVIGSTAVAGWQTAVNSFYSDISAYGPVIVHSVICEQGEQGHTGAHSPVPGPPTPILSLEVDDRIATQRRRLNR